MHDYLILDVFTSAPLEGNPVAVFTDAHDLDDETMQRAARELNLSETVFLLPGNRVRIFTPTTELPFAGHPVLGTAFVVAERDDVDQVVLATGAGEVKIELSDGYGEMAQPIPVLERFDRSEELLAALGVARSELPVEAYRQGPLHVYVMLESKDTVAALDPDISALAKLGAFGVSCFAGSGSSFKTRMFGPGVGVAEDPATGSAAGPLALHLARHGRIEFGQQIEISQGAEIGRPSLLRARVEGSSERVERVLVGGSAVLVAHGSYLLD